MVQTVRTSPQRRVSVETTARLHMGFIDLNGGLGRRFGSIGLSLDKPVLRLDACLQPDFSAVGPGSERVVDYARTFARRAGIAGGARFELLSAIPDHAGLGSGTQIALAVGSALSRLYDLGLDTVQVAVMTARGARSGIGIGAFDDGGLLVDAGRGPDTLVPPIVARMHFPDPWRVLLVYDPASEGVHGSEEKQAFGAMPDFSPEQAASLARLVLMQALPAVAERDLLAFGAAISELQRVVGDYFAPAQGGGRYLSPRVAAAMAWLEQQGVGCVGQSSWGPTGFAVVEDAARAAVLQQQLQKHYPALHYEICAARNTGSKVTSANDGL